MHVSLTNKKARLDSLLAHKHANGGWAVGPNGPCRAMISNEGMDVQGIIVSCGMILDRYPRTCM